MNIARPHWLTQVVTVIGVCAIALEGVYPDYAGILKGVAAVCTVLASANVTSDRPKPPVDGQGVAR